MQGTGDDSSVAVSGHRGARNLNFRFCDPASAAGGALQCNAMQNGADDPIGSAIKRMIGQGCPQFSIERKSVPRAIQYMSAMLDRHPGLWHRIAEMRSMRGTALLAPTNRGERFPNWPDWCYFPRGMAAVALVPDRKDDVDHVKVAHELESEAVAGAGGMANDARDLPLRCNPFL